MKVRILIYIIRSQLNSATDISCLYAASIPAAPFTNDTSAAYAQNPVSCPFNAGCMLIIQLFSIGFSFPRLPTAFGRVTGRLDCCSPQTR